MGQPIGFAIDDWQGAETPVHEGVEGTRCRLEPLSADRHAEALHEAFAANADGSNWTYLPYGPFESAAAYAACVRDFERFGAVLDQSERIRADGAGTAENCDSLGHRWFGTRLGA